MLLWIHLVVAVISQFSGLLHLKSTHPCPVWRRFTEDLLRGWFSNGLAYWEVDSINLKVVHPLCNVSVKSATDGVEIKFHVEVSSRLIYMKITLPPGESKSSTGAVWILNISPLTGCIFVELGRNLCISMFPALLVKYKYFRPNYQLFPIWLISSVGRVSV